MEPIPDTWPPASREDSPTAPLFPLPNVFLFPFQVLPLHVFEPRYRQMIEDSLDGPGRIVMGTVHEDERDRLEGNPTVSSVAGIGEIARHVKLDDGRFNIWLVGLARARIAEVASERLYRRVTYRILPEIPCTPDDASRLRGPLEEAILSRVQNVLNLPDGVSTGALADLLLQSMHLPQAEMESLFAEIDTTRRAERALAAHQRHPT